MPLRMPWMLVFAALGAVRLFLTGDRDIVAVNGPYDEYWYVSSALRFIWGGEYNHMAFAHLPVYSAWLWLLYLFGIPGRLAIDVVWLVASFYLAFALRGFTGRRWVGIVVFAFLALHPYTLAIFDLALAETLLTVLTAAVLAGFIELWNCREEGSVPRRMLAWGTASLGFALAFHSRKEGLILLVPLALLAAWSLYRRRDWWIRGRRRNLGVAFVAAPLLATMLLGMALAAVNGVRWGIPARFELAAPGYNRAMDALFAIDSGERTPKQVTVTARTRALAYQASPTFSQLRAFYEGPPGRALVAYTAPYSSAPGEIPNGWFYWSLRDAGVMAGWHKDAPAADAKYQAIADELERAFEQGSLRRRMVPLSMIDPDIAKWIGDVPDSFQKGLWIIVAPDPWKLGRPVENATPKQLEDFVKVYGRRRLPGAAILKGWVAAPAGSEVGFGADQQVFTWHPLAGPTRPDVPGAFPFTLSSGAQERATHFHVRLPDRSTRSIGLASLSVGKVFRVPGEPVVHLGVDQLSLGVASSRLSVLFGTANQPPPFDWFIPFGVVWGAFGWTLALVGLVGLIVGGFVVDPRTRPAVLLSLICLFSVLARVALLSLLDASSWNGLQARYFMPAIAPFAVFGAIGAWMLWESARKVKSRFPSREPHK